MGNQTSQQNGREQILVQENLPSQQVQLVSFCSLFRFATNLDKLYMVIGTIMAILTGITKPAFQVLFGMILDTYGLAMTNKDLFYEKTTTYLYYFLIMGVIVFILTWIMLSLWMIAGDRQGIKCRQVYLHALFSQEIAWFDKQNQSELATNFSTQTFAFQEAIGEKVATFISTITLTIAGFVISFYKGWKLTLVMICTLPVTTVMWYGYIMMIQKKESKMDNQYSTANGKVEESLSAIKTVKSLNGENHQASAFSGILDKISQKIYCYVILSSLSFGSQFCIILLTHSLAFWYGSTLINQKIQNWNHAYTAGDVMTVMMLMLSAGQNLSQLVPCLKKFTQGQQAATGIYSIIDRIPEIKRNPYGKKLFNPQGIIQFHNVTFSYPKNPTQLILNNISFKIQPDVTSALVGQSGCGKSTIMQLIMRFYDPNQGKITLDGIDLKQFDLLWLRENIGYVGQQPVLFATTIRQNLLFGKSNATDQQIITALRKAQALDFVENFQNKLQTYVGYGGSQLSGGQKQRLAIARAILKNPKIMLFDEATSSLDRKNQKLIQQNLDRISIGKTTICIAHRIKTIMNSETIFVIQKGNIKEKGKFQELNRFRGIKFEQRQSDVFNQSEYKISKIKKTLQEQYEEKLQKQRKQNEEKQELLKKYEENSFWRLLKYNQSNCLLFTIGAIFALINGCIFPVTSIVASKILIMLTKLQATSYSVTQSAIIKVIVIYVLLAILTLFTHTFQTYIFSILAEKLTTKLRIQCFSKMLKMPIPWFDFPKNNSGTLSSRLAIDCKQVNGLVQNLVGLNLQNIGCLISGLIIAFYSDWRVSLVTLALLPFLIFAILISAKFSEGFSAQTDQAYKDSSNLIMQSMINIRTVTSFGVQNSIAGKYSQKLKEPSELAVRKGNISGLLYGLSQMIMFVIFGLIFWICSILIKNYNVTAQSVFNVIYTIMMIAWTVGGNAQLMPDMGKCNNSAANLFQILDGQDQDQLQTLSNSNKITRYNKNGAIQIRNVTFKYPNRQVQVFKNLSMKIEAGTKVALIGSSGCGKSTIIQMLMRFYDPIEGEILIDGTPLRQYDIHYLRSLFGVVSQEPVLFNTSIIKNIRYNLQDVTINHIKQAARKANALSFIQTSNSEIFTVSEKQQINNEKGFGKSVGVRGSQLSGGQKQRIAIARAIIRNPQILLLDEATSALDANNEKIVQASLDKLMQGLTTITVAHRIDTIKNSNKIYVFENGRIVQSGTYNDLVRLKKVFYNFEQGNSK